MGSTIIDCWSPSAISRQTKPGNAARRSRGSPSRRWRSGSLPPPAGRSCPPAPRRPKAVTGRRVWGCPDAVTASPNRRPGVSVGACPRDGSPGLPCTVSSDAVDTGRRAPFRLVKRPAEQVDRHMVEERREPDMPIGSCGLTYAIQCAGCDLPALRLARAARVSADAALKNSNAHYCLELRVVLVTGAGFGLCTLFVFVDRVRPPQRQ